MGITIEKSSNSGLSGELETYEAHKAELLAEHEGKFVLIKGDKIVGVYDTHEEALARGYQDYLDEPFLAHEISPVELPIYFYQIKATAS